MKKVEVKCHTCDGDKKKDYGRGLEDCRYCQGKGKVDAWVEDKK